MSMLFGVIFILRLIVGTIFLIAGIVKLKSGSSQFLSAIMGYELVPKFVAAVLASLLPWLEVVVGGLLILGLWSQFSVVAGVILLLIFSSGIAISLLRDKDNDCGCFRTVTPVQWRLIYRNLILLGLLILVYGTKGGLWSIDDGVTIPPDWQIHFSTNIAVLIGLWFFAFLTVWTLHLSIRPTAQANKP
jgi:uncharacterized membrane protein YphA (DoxX/SURF4 family)